MVNYSYRSFSDDTMSVDLPLEFITLIICFLLIGGLHEMSRQSDVQQGQMKQRHHIIYLLIYIFINNKDMI